MLEKGTKGFYEVYAKISLADLYNKRLEDSKVLTVESPDIQSEELDIGIEVTLGYTQQQCITNAITNKNFNKNKSFSDIKKDIEDNYKCFKGELFKVGKTNCMSSTKGLFDTKIIIDTIIDRVNNKSNKKNYKNFSTNGLYVFSGYSLLNENEISDLYREVTKCENYNFDILFINCIDCLYICKNGKVDRIEISEEHLKKYNEDTEKYTGK